MSQSRLPLLSASSVDLLQEVSTAVEQLFQQHMAALVMYAEVLALVHCCLSIDTNRNSNNHYSLLS